MTAHLPLIADLANPQLTQALQAALSVSTADIAAHAAREGLQGAQIGARIEAARVTAVNDRLSATP